MHIRIYSICNKHLLSLLILLVAIVLAIGSIPGITRESFTPPPEIIGCMPVAAESIAYTISVRVSGFTGEGDVDLEGAHVAVSVSAEDAASIGTDDLCKMEYSQLASLNGVTDGLGLIEFTTPPYTWDDSRESLTIWVRTSKEGWTSSSETIKVSYALNGINQRLVNLRLRQEEWTK